MPRLTGEVLPQVSAGLARSSGFCGDVSVEKGLPRKSGGLWVWRLSLAFFTFGMFILEI